MASERAIGHPIGGKLTTRAKDQALARLARGQYGVVARRQLRGMGFSDRAIDRRLERLQLHEVFRGVFVFGSRRISREGRWMAAVLVSGEGAVLSHRSAARFWRLLPLAAERIDVTCRGGRARREGIVGHRAILREDEWLVEDGIPVTSPFRTIFDLAAVVASGRWSGLGMRPKFGG